jgi:hypothetical protein
MILARDFLRVFACPWLMLPRRRGAIDEQREPRSLRGSRCLATRRRLVTVHQPSAPGIRKMEKTTMNTLKNLTTLIALSLASSSFAQTPGAPATIFEHTNFAGKSQALVEGMNVGPLALGNDSASSVKVSPCWTVTLYEHARGTGRELVLRADDADLINDNFNDIVSNVLVERDLSCGPPATIFEHINFGGKSQALVEGMNVGPLALGNDVASSVKVSECFKVTLYGAGPGQNGPELVLTADNADLTNDNFNDILSNVLVERDPNCSR